MYDNVYAEKNGTNMVSAVTDNHIAREITNCFELITNISCYSHIIDVTRRACAIQTFKITNLESLLRLLETTNIACDVGSVKIGSCTRGVPFLI